jgi:hypothetical protein
MVEELPAPLVEAARDGRLVIFAGAGVSAVAPSELPGWNQLSVYISKALLERATKLSAEIALSPEFNSDDVEIIERISADNTIPPEYRAQILHEVSGDRYFRALSCLDVAAINTAHARLAALLAGGHVSGVITTNFDRLIERAIEASDSAVNAAFDADGFEAFAKATAKQPRAIPILKVHGCASQPESMIDTLKQRKLGRSGAMERAIRRFENRYILFLGFSANDLAFDANYLGLRYLASSSPGAVYVAWPKAPELSPGAKKLLSLFGDKGHVVHAETADLLAALCSAVNIDTAGTDIDARTQSGHAEFEAKLTAWADTLTLPAAGLCLSAIFEAAGHGERAARILDRMVRKLLFDSTKEDPDWHAVSFHNGRMGAALGRFTNVQDMGGAESNASEESFQSLLRAAAMDEHIGSAVHLGAGYLWKGRVSHALEEAKKAMYYLEVDRESNQFVLRATPKIPEEPHLRLSAEQAVDFWITATQVYSILHEPKHPAIVRAMAPHIVELALRAGDPVRAAKAAAFYHLMSATVFYEPIDATHDAVLAEAGSIGDVAHRGVLKLAEGRFLVGHGGRDLVREGALKPAELGPQALAALEESIECLSATGMSSWELYAQIQRLKALTDLARFEEVSTGLDSLFESGERIPVLLPELQMTVGQVQRVCRQDDAARANFEDAVHNAELMGFPEKNINYLRQYLQ